MKTLVIVLFLAIMTISISAQSQNNMIFGNAKVKYRNMEKTGTVLTAIGGAALFTGNILYWKIYNSDDTGQPLRDKASTYGHIMLGGLGLMAIGIPLWATGKSKLRHIEIEARLINFKGITSANGVGLKIRF